MGWTDGALVGLGFAASSRNPTLSRAGSREPEEVACPFPGHYTTLIGAESILLRPKPQAWGHCFSAGQPWQTQGEAQTGPADCLPILSLPASFWVAHPVLKVTESSHLQYPREVVRFMLCIGSRVDHSSSCSQLATSSLQAEVQCFPSRAPSPVHHASCWAFFSALRPHLLTTHIPGSRASRTQAGQSLSPTAYPPRLQGFQGIQGSTLNPSQQGYGVRATPYLCASATF